jgi:hypothetical protein
MIIKRIDATHFDVFWGTGWDNWARFNIEYNVEKKHKFLRQEKGIEVPRPVMQELITRFTVRKHQPTKESV